MKRNSLFRCLAFNLLSLFAFGIPGVQAQTGAVNITTTAVPFLRIAPDARAGGMGDMGVATSPDVNSGFYNRAKLPFANKRTGFGLSYTPWMHDVSNDIYLLTGSVFHQLDELEAISAGIRYFNIGEIPMEDYSGNKLFSVHPREWAFDFGYSRKLSNTLGLAVALRYINSKLVTGTVNGVNYKAGNTVAGDISLYYNGADSASGGWSAGLALSNLGGKIGYTNDATQKAFLPANLGVGLAYNAVIDEDNRFIIGVEMNKLLVPAVTDTSAAALDDYHSKSVINGWTSSFKNSNYRFSFGAEYTFHKLFSARLGYIIEPKDEGIQNGFTAGVGVGWDAFALNFSYLANSGNGTIVNPLANTLRFGLTYHLGK